MARVPLDIQSLVIELVYMSCQHEAIDYSTLQRLRTMRIRPVFLSVSGRPTVVSALLHVWPSARALEVEAWYDAELATMRTQPSVEALSIHTDWINEAFLRHLVSSSVFPRLRSLCITGSFVATPAPRAVFEHLARIESLVLAWLPAEAMALPQTLRHLGYHFYGIGKEPIAGARLLMDAARALPELTRVTAMRCSSPEVLKEFERACEDYGVELVVYEKPWCFPRPGNVDWI
ncbi:hypothetical protein FA95DRAFT_1339180 [Auriscalpium vulgare]|uniref:Uncharacterized protein n=1 Tax=Auriscalpium vulgare TaxID=40419 RepID=A0ACB8R2X2_9AGAM|nr:hypothetical protein FA95DRAFT_1339180 [Auriscalpium vulgare]